MLLLLGIGAAAAAAGVSSLKGSGGGSSSGSEQDYDSTYGSEKTHVRTVEHSDGSSTQFVHYQDKNGDTNIVMRDLDANGVETGHTTAHPDQVNYHGSHEIK